MHNAPPIETPLSFISSAVHKPVSDIPESLRAVFHALLAYTLALRPPPGATEGPTAKQAADQLLDAVLGSPTNSSVVSTLATWSEEASLILADLEALEHTEVALGSFRVRAEWLAARARLLQEEHREANEKCSYLIRRLTALAYRRGVRVFGLCRAHRANWTARVHALRPTSEKVVLAPESDEPRTLPSQDVSASRAVQREIEQASVALSLLKRAAQRGAIVVVGGAAKEKTREQIEQLTDLKIEWIETRGGGTRLVEPIVKRLQDAGIAALVLVQGAMLHRHSQPLVAAARQSMTPMGYASKGGVSSVLRALFDIEATLHGEHVADRAA